MYRLSTLGRAAALGAAGCLVALAACEQTRDFVAPIAPPTAVNPIFQSYVAIGNSITAGFQSNGFLAQSRSRRISFTSSSALPTDNL